ARASSATACGFVPPTPVFGAIRRPESFDTSVNRGGAADAMEGRSNSARSALIGETPKKDEDRMATKRHKVPQKENQDQREFNSKLWSLPSVFFLCLLCLFVANLFV